MCHVRRTVGTRPIVLPALLAAGCAASQYALMRTDLTCDRALRVTHRTMVALGYTITEMTPPGMYAGAIAGTKQDARGNRVSGRVEIHCTATNVVLQPVESQVFSSFDFSRAFDYSFRELVQRPDLEEPAKAIGLQVLVERLDRYQARLDLGGSPTTGDALPVRITIRNHTDRAVTVDPADVKLAPPDGDAVAPLAGEALQRATAAGAAGDHIRHDALEHATVPAHSSVTRFLVYPPGAYKEAQISIADTETGETEGFFAPVQ